MIRSRLSVKCFQLLLVTVVVSGVTAQESQPSERHGLPEDWTHHHIVFTADFLRTHPDIMIREPRALHQIYRRWGHLLAPNAGIDVNNTHDFQDSAHKGPQGDWNVQLGAGTTAFGTSPAKYQTNPAAVPSCTQDFVVFGINANGLQQVGATNGQATLVAYNQLYTGPGGVGGICSTDPGGPGPAYYFSYNTSTLTNGRIRTSPVISLDGTKLAFIESSANGSAVHVLTIGTTGNNGTNVVIPVIPGTGNNAKLVTINYTTANNNHSSPWVDYPSDTLYVGADDGKLYKVTGVFKGTPTQVTGGGWPIAVTGAIQITGPVFDASTGNLFIGDSRGVLHSVNAITPGTVKNLAVGTAGQPNSQILDAPIVDSNGNVFATSSNDGTSAVVVQASTTNLSQLARIRIGVGSTTGTNVNLYDGDFDNAFYSSENSGHYYLCGTGTSVTGGIEPYRYHLAFTGGLLQSDAAPVQISTSTAARCGPLTEFYNPNIGGGTDFFFWGVTSNCVGAGGCIMELSNGTTVTTAAATAGTSAVIVDNEASQSGGSQTSNIYYATQGGSLATRLATKAQQGALN
jgi:hypothetical protein